MINPEPVRGFGVAGFPFVAGTSGKQNSELFEYRRLT
jgi:hypothetical protein